MGESVEIVGLDRLIATLNQFAHDLEKLAPETVIAIIGRVAQTRAPKRTGRLAASFSGTSGAGEQILRFGTEYAAPIHFGVGPRPGLRGPHNIRPNPYLFGAVEETQNQWVEQYEAEIRDAVKKVKGA